MGFGLLGFVTFVFEASVPELSGFRGFELWGFGCRVFSEFGLGRSGV